MKEKRKRGQSREQGKEDLEALYLLITQEKIKYAMHPLFLHTRNKGLMGLLASTGLRISEALQLKIFQYEKETEDPLFGALFKVHTEKGGNIRDKILLPRRGELSSFVQLFEEYVLITENLSPKPSPQNYIFPAASKGGVTWREPLSRSGAFIIVKNTTGYFPHYFRGVCETFYGKKVFRGDPWAHARHFGLRRIDSSIDYVGGEREEKTRRKILRA